MKILPHNFLNELTDFRTEHFIKKLIKHLDSEDEYTLSNPSHKIDSIKDFLLIMHSFPQFKDSMELVNLVLHHDTSSHGLVVQLIAILDIVERSKKAFKESKNLYEGVESINTILVDHGVEIKNVNTLSHRLLAPDGWQINEEFKEYRIWRAFIDFRKDGSRKLNLCVSKCFELDTKLNAMASALNVPNDVCIQYSRPTIVVED